MDIYFIRQETYYGPFFSTLERAVEYLSCDDVEWWQKYGADVLDDKSPYTSIQKVTLDNTDTHFDG